MNKIVVYLVLIVISLGGGLLIGTNNLPGEWYQSLAKPFFTPPNWLFAPAWTILYIFIGIAGARTWLQGPALPAMLIWVGQMALNFLWSPLFFGLQMPGPALGVILVLLLVILWFIANRWHADRVSALLFIPYAAWVAFASALNGAIVALN